MNGANSPDPARPSSGTDRDPAEVRAPALREEPVEICVDGLQLPGTLAIPRAARGAVLFAHGDGSNRFRPHHRAVADGLQRAGFATLLFDLLSPEEELVDGVDGLPRFNVQLFARRLVAATVWISAYPTTRLLSFGYFGSSMGAAAALIAAARLGGAISAVVARGGRTDLAASIFGEITAPTLLIVGGRDPDVLALNCTALAQLRCEKSLSVVPRATHLFEEAGALESVVELAAQWFFKHLRAPPTTPVRE